MNIYLIERTDKVDYDEYDAFVVVANSSKEARELLVQLYIRDKIYDSWSDNNKVNLIGTTTKYKKTRVILGSFNAG